MYRKKITRPFALKFAISAISISRIRNAYIRINRLLIRKRIKVGHWSWFKPGSFPYFKMSYYRLIFPSHLPTYSVWLQYCIFAYCTQYTRSRVPILTYIAQCEGEKCFSLLIRIIITQIKFSFLRSLLHTASIQYNISMLRIFPHNYVNSKKIRLGRQNFRSD